MASNALESRHQRRALNVITPNFRVSNDMRTKVPWTHADCHSLGNAVHVEYSRPGTQHKPVDAFSPKTCCATRLRFLHEGFAETSPGVPQ